MIPLYIKTTLICFFICLNLKSQDTITLHLENKEYSVESVVGFLHLSNIETLKTDIQSLNPRFWRLGNTVINKQDRIRTIQELEELNITPILVFSDFYSNTPRENSSWKRPFEKPLVFLGMVEHLYKENGNKIIYDLWNEPNIKSYWLGSNNDFFNSFKIAHDKIRSLPGGDKALITGPSTAGFDKEFIEEFLDFCNKNNIRVDILNWHENNDKSKVFDMESHIKYAREIWIKKYPRVNIKNIFIAEMISKNEQFDPLAILAYLNSLEHSNALGGCKSCWSNDPRKGGNTCLNNSINGIIDGEGQPRSTWWIYKFYKESLSYRIHYTKNNQKIISIPYLDKSENTINLILGNLNSNNRNLNIVLNSIKTQSKSKVDYTLFEIYNSGINKLLSPCKVFSRTTTNTVIRIKDLNSSSVYLLRLTKE